MPRVQLYAAEVDHPGERGGVVDDREHGRVPAGKPDELLADVVRVPRHALLVEESGVDAVRVALHVEGTTAEVRQRAVGDVDVVAHEVALRQPALGEEDLVRIRERNLVATDAHGGAVSSRSARSGCSLCSCRNTTRAGSISRWSRSTTSSSSSRPTRSPRRTWA